jgi:GNAT superfamily N-acetyltransferase
MTSAHGFRAHKRRTILTWERRLAGAVHILAGPPEVRSDSCQTSRPGGWIVVAMGAWEPTGTTSAATAGRSPDVTVASFIRPTPAAVRWLRPPASGDLLRISEMWQRCSLATRIGRFHAPVRVIPPAYLETVLSDPSASLVAVPGKTGAVVALASLVTDGGGSAELGVVVEDAWQRRGIGGYLVAHLIAAAPARQITELTASVLAQNRQVADLLRRIPGDFSVTRDGTTLSIRVRLASAGSTPALAVRRS